jgi:hypothetical protein
VRNQGEFYIANREGDKRPIAVMNWTANPAIVKQADNVIFSVNGTEVNRQPKRKLHADGLYGFRIGHNLDVDVDQISTPK